MFVLVDSFPMEYIDNEIRLILNTINQVEEKWATYSDFLSISAIEPDILASVFNDYIRNNHIEDESELVDLLTNWGDNSQAYLLFVRTVVMVTIVKSCRYITLAKLQGCPEFDGLDIYYDSIMVRGDSVVVTFTGAVMGQA